MFKSSESSFLKLKSLIPSSFLEPKNHWPPKKEKKITNKKYLLKTLGKQAPALELESDQSKDLKDQLMHSEIKDQSEVKELKELKENFTFNIRKTVVRREKKTHLKHVLQKLEKGKEKRQNLYKENKEKFLQDKIDFEFRKAELKLNNVKVQDDSKLLKKSLARISAKKKKSEKEWKKRIKTQEHLKIKKQKKRMENLKRRRPGFK